MIILLYNMDAEAVHVMCRAYRLNDERVAAYAQSKKTDAKSVASKVREVYNS